MVRQILMIECLKMNKISKKVIKLIREDMENWKVELKAGGQTPK